MRFLVDSNILLRFTQTNSQQYAVTRKAIIELKLASQTIYIVPQNLIEYWAVATRPLENNGLGFSVQETQKEIKRFKRLFELLDDSSNIFQRWETLVDKYSVLGKNVHDARLVAAMLAHGITELLTFNGKDFKRFSEINVINPADL